MVEESDNSVDFDAMTEEELEKYIKGDHNQEPEEETEGPKGEPEVDNEEVEEKEEVQDSETPLQGPEYESDPFIDRFKDKTQDELIEIIRNGTRKISQQGNANSEYKKRIEVLENMLKQNKPNTDGYDPSDLDTIRQIARNEALEAHRQMIEMQQQQAIAEAESARAENDQAWLMAQYLMEPEQAEKVKGILLTEIQQNPDSTVNVKGWARDRIRELISKGNQKPVQQTQKVVRRPLSGGMAVGSGQVNTPSPVYSNQSLDGGPSDPEEYREWLAKKHGIKI